MKFCLLPVLFFSIVLVAAGELSRDDEKRLRDVEIAGITEDTYRKEDGEKSEELEINTFQNEDDDGKGFRMRIIVELEGQDKKRYIAGFTANRPDDLNSEYTGEDYWIFRMPHGDLGRLSIEGYLVQYGFMDGDTFVVFAEDENHSEEVLEGVRNRTTLPFPGKVRLKHYYMFVDDEEGEMESMPKTLQAVPVKK